MISSTSSSSSSSETQTTDTETKPTNVELGNNKPMSNLYSIPTKTNKITDYKSFIEVVYYIMNSKVWFISYGVVIIINLILLIWSKKNYLKASTDVKFHPESNKNKSGDHDDKLNTPLLKSSEENSEDDIL